MNYPQTVYDHYATAVLKRFNTSCHNVQKVMDCGLIDAPG